MIIADHGNNVLLKLREASSEPSIFTSFYLGSVLSIQHVAVEPGVEDSYFVTSKEHHAILRVRVLGDYHNVTAIAGNGTAALTDGVGTAATFNFPEFIVATDADTLIVSDSGNSVIRRMVRTSGDTWHVSTLAGSGKEFYADGVGTMASFHFPKGIAVVPKQYLPEGKAQIFVADYGFRSFY